MSEMKCYFDRVPACAIFCGGCPNYTRDKNPCPGAGINIKRCESCKTFHLCCKEKGITHCYQCDQFPCSKFKAFSKRWEKYGQNITDNQEVLKRIGDIEFLKVFNDKADKDT